MVFKYHAIKEGGKGGTLKAHFYSQGGRGGGLVRPKPAHTILEQLLTLQQEKLNIELGITQKY